MSRPLLHLRTASGFYFKTITELFRASFSEIIFSATEKGLFSRMTNEQSTKLFDLVLSTEGMDMFYVREPFFFGVNAAHLYKIISSLKKKDALELVVEEDTPNCLQITITPHHGRYTDTGFVRTERVQNIEIELPAGYDSCIRGPSSKFNKVIKELLSISKEVQIKGNLSFIGFHAVVDGILGKGTQFVADSASSSPREEEIILYDETYHYDEIGKLGKLAGFGNPIEFYIKEYLPLKMRVTIGDIGELSVYICNNR